MNVAILRRRKLGRTSCREVAANMHNTAVVRNWKDRFPAGTKVVFRWGCSSNVPEGTLVVNKAEAMHRVNQKGAFRVALAEAGLCLPVYTDMDDMSDNAFDDGPFIVRKDPHSQGRGLWRVDSWEMCEHICSTLDKYYIAPYIPKVAEYRVFVCQGRVVWVAKKTPANPAAIAWNVAKGGRFDNVSWGDWPLKACRLAIDAWRLSGLDFGGVDIMIDEDNGVHVLEINSAPSQTSPYRQSCTAKAFQYIVDEVENTGKFTKEITLIDGKGDWKKFAHPALDPKVMIGGN